MKLFPYPISKFLKESKGAALAETVIMFPIFITLLSGIFELAFYVFINNKVVRTAGVLGDMITRQNLTSTALTGLMNTASTVFQPFNFNTSGKVVVSQVQNAKLSNLASDMKISWQQSINGGSSKFGAAGSAPSNLPGGIVVVSNQTMVLTEVYYQYNPLIFNGLVSPRQLYAVSVYVPRSGDMNTLLTG